MVISLSYSVVSVNVCTEQRLNIVDYEKCCIVHLVGELLNMLAHYTHSIIYRHNTIQLNSLFDHMYASNYF